MPVSQITPMRSNICIRVFDSIPTEHFSLALFLLKEILLSSRTPNGHMFRFNINSYYFYEPHIRRIKSNEVKYPAIISLNR